MLTPTIGSTSGLSIAASQGQNNIEVDFLVRNVYQKIKSLENKYDDSEAHYGDVNNDKE